MMSRSHWSLLIYLLLVTGQIDYSIANSDPCFFWDHAIYVNGKCLKRFSFDKVLVYWHTKDQCSQNNQGQLARLSSLDEFEAAKNLMGDFTDAGIGEPRVGDSSSWNSLLPSLIDGRPCTLTMTPDPVITCPDYYQDDLFICEKDHGDLCYGYLQESTYVNGSCVHISSTATDWNTASESCQAMGAILAEPQLDTTRTWISKQAESKGDLWLGALDDEGSRLQWQYTDLPPPASGLADTVGATYMSRMGGILSQSTASYRYACQKELQNPCDGIMQGSVFSSGFCLKAFQDKKTRNEALVYCQQMGAYLAYPFDDRLKETVELLLRYRVGGDFVTWVEGNHTFYGVTPSYGDPRTGCLTYRPRLHDGTLQLVSQDCLQKTGFICQKDAHLKPKRYVVPLITRRSHGGAYTTTPLSIPYLHVASPYPETRVHLKLTTYVDGVEDGVSQILTSVSRRSGVSYVDYKLRDLMGLELGMVEVNASLPVRVQLYLYGNTSADYEFVMILPLLMDPHHRITYEVQVPGLIMSDRKVHQAYILATYHDRTFLRLSHPLTLNVRFNGAVINGWRKAKVYMSSYEVIHVESQDSLDGLIIKASKEISLFLASGMSKSEVNFLIQQRLPEMTYYDFAAMESLTGYDSSVQWQRSYDDSGPQPSISIQVDQANSDVSDSTSGILPITSATYVILNETASLWQGLTKSSISGIGLTPMCTMVLVPRTLWLNYYILDVPTITDAKYEGSTLNLIVRVEDKARIYMNGISFGDFQCSDVQAYTGMVICYKELPSDMKSNTLYLGSSRTFGAYLVMNFADGEIACVPLGADNRMYIHIEEPTTPATTTQTTECPQTTQCPDVTTSDCPQTTQCPDVTTCDCPQTTQCPDVTTSDCPQTTQCPEVTTRDCPQTTQCPAVVTNDCGPNATLPDTTTSATTGPWTLMTVKPGYALCKIPPAVLKVDTPEEVKELVSEIKSNLTVDPKNTSAHIRKLTSAKDPRESSASMGIMAIILLSLVLAMIVLPDLGSLVRHWHGRHCSRTHSKHRDGGRVAYQNK